MKKTIDHSYESIQQALQIAVDNGNDIPLAAERSGIPQGTLYTYFQRIQKGASIHGIHSRCGTSAVFSVMNTDECSLRWFPALEIEEKP